MSAYTTTVWLSPAAFGLPGEPMQAIRFDVEAPTPEHACEVAFAVCNSYPEEMFCDPAYHEVVAEYRSRKHRSLSVGDFVQVNHAWFVCATAGFKPAGPPA